MRSSVLLCALVSAVLLHSQHANAFVAQPLLLSTDGTKRCPSLSATTLNMGSGYFLRPTARDGQSQDKDSKNEELAFKNVISNLKNNIGREGFNGDDAKKHISIMEKVETEVEAEEKRFLGSRRLYKFTRAATKTLQRPMKRKNHPGEEYRPSRH